MKIRIIDQEISIIFKTSLPSGRVGENSLRVTPPNKKYEEPAFINVPALGDIQAQDISEIIRALELARSLADGSLEIY